tara:strand:+ start:5018 stop:5413 length:396 start_codon:yes stop_codon:yes gene_type:complete
MNEYNIAIMIALIISMTLNIGLLWYNRRLIVKLLFVSDNLNDLVSMIESYRNHLKVLYSTEMYYGDETMKHLIAHTTSLSELLEEYEDITYLTEPMEFGLEQEEESFEENEENRESPPADVFYGGTRTGNN